MGGKSTKLLYNEERKRKYIQEHDHKKIDVIESLFRATSDYEFDSGVDLGGMPPHQIERIINSCFGSNASSITTTRSRIRRYHQWCVRNGLEQRQGLENVKIDSSITKRKTMVESPMHLQKIMDKIFPPTRDNTIECLLRCYLWMAFAGVEEKETNMVHCSNVDLESMCIFYDGREYPIYRHAYEAFWLAKNETTMRYVNANYSKDSILPKIDSGYLLRSIKSGQPKTSSFGSLARRIFKDSGYEINYRSLQLSGLFFRTLKEEQLRGYYDFEEEVKLRASKKCVDLKSPEGVLFRRRNERSLKEDYYAWKRAFE